MLEKILFACVVTWELLGNIHSEELRCRQVQSFHWLERLKLHGCCVRFGHKTHIYIYIYIYIFRSNVTRGMSLAYLYGHTPFCIKKSQK